MHGDVGEWAQPIPSAGITQSRFSGRRWTIALSARLPELPVVNECNVAHAKLRGVKTRTLLILAAVTGTAIIVAFTIQLLTDGRFLGAV